MAELADDMLLIAVITERISLNEEMMSLLEVPVLLDGRFVLEASDTEEMGVELFIMMYPFYKRWQKMGVNGT